MQTYQRLEYPKIWAVIKEQSISDDGILEDGDLTDPSTSTQIVIEDSTGTVVQAATAMTQSETGKYYYYGYAIPATANTGVWNYEVRANDGGIISVGRGSFLVEEHVA